MKEALAHPESVRLTGRARRQRPRSRLPHWLRTTLIVIGGIVLYLLLLWSFSYLRAWLPAAHP
jgi:type VI protein secretion system component VasF